MGAGCKSGKLLLLLLYTEKKKKKKRIEWGQSCWKIQRIRQLFSAWILAAAGEAPTSVSYGSLLWNTSLKKSIKNHWRTLLRNITHSFQWVPFILFKLHESKLYSSNWGRNWISPQCFSSTFTKLCNQHHQFQNIFITPTRNSTPVSSQGIDF